MKLHRIIAILAVSIALALTTYAANDIASCCADNACCKNAVCCTKDKACSKDKTCCAKCEKKDCCKNDSCDMKDKDTNHCVHN